MIKEFIIFFFMVAAVFYGIYLIVNYRRNIIFYKYSRAHRALQPLQQVNVAEQEIRKRVEKAFEQQQQSIYARSLRPHAHDCPDPLTCTKFPCWTPTPDMIIASSKVKLKTRQEREAEYRYKRLAHQKSMAKLRFGLQETSNNKQ
jgi:hypothetical protein